jgi:purine-cytosine permease-like protein
MKHIKFRTGFTIFVIFFGISLLEAIQTQNWMMVVFWAGIALLFLLMDSRQKKEN